MNECLKLFDLTKTVVFDTAAVFRFLVKNTIPWFPETKADNLQAQLGACKNAEDDTSFHKMM